VKGAAMSDITNRTNDRFDEENRRAEEYVEKGNLADAAKILVNIVGSDPDNARAYNSMGIISWMRKAWEDAYSMFIKAVQLQPDFQDALVNLFDAALKLRKIDQVTPLFDKALEINNELEDVRLIAKSMHEQGDEIYQSQRGMMIGQYHPKIEKADKLVEEGKLFEAMEKYLEINDTEGANADAFCGLGIISFYQQRYEDAYTLFLESIKLNPTRNDTFMNLLDAAKACNKVNQAREIYHTYLKEIPHLQSIALHFDVQPEI
jgi:tetratricopeptide (TPR) repeat protein